MSGQFLAATALAATFAAAAAAPASVLSLVDNAGDMGTVTVAPGEAFTVTLRLTADEGFRGLTAFLRDPGFGGATRFTLTDRTRLASNPFTDATRSDATFDNDPLNATTEDVGYTSDGTVAAANTYDLMTLTIAPSLSLAEGTYSLGFGPDSGLTNAAFEDVAFTGLGSYSVTVTAVPEPQALCLLAGVGAAALRRRRSR